MGCIVRIVLVVAVAACSSRSKAPPPAPVPLVLSSPGPLFAGHAALDDPQGCASCHVNNTAQLDNNKCLACHQPLAALMQAGKGLHASAVVRGKPCQSCHMDHRGRPFDPMGWRSLRGGRDGFDHQLTGWPLEGVHATRTCDDCHSARDKQGLRLFVGTDRLCGSCHRDTPHGAKRDLLACDRCHSTAAWQPPLRVLRFDHDDRKDARVPLLGAHAAVACAACHPAARFTLDLSAPERCDTCHASPHAGQLFSKGDCTTCHSPRGKTFAAAEAFDHTERTRFDLGGHKSLTCVTCHPKTLGMTKPSGACETCHATRSPHAKRFAAFGSPPACALCHSTRFSAMPQPKWRSTGFDHAKNTKFPLTDKHAELACRACHRGSGPTNFEKLDASAGCTGCHAHRTVHDKKYANAECTKCHVRAGSLQVIAPP
ncbi:MAG TPA: cytochrome c3 family protein [Kofleriaceae bacterium]